MTSVGAPTATGRLSASPVPYPAREQADEHDRERGRGVWRPGRRRDHDPDEDDRQQPAQGPVTAALPRPGYRRDHLCDRHRTRLPLRQVSAEYWFDGQVPRELAQVGPGLRGIGGRGSLLELIQRQPAIRVRVPEDVDNTLPLSIGRTDRSVGHRRGPFLVFLIDPNSASGGNLAAGRGLRDGLRAAPAVRVDVDLGQPNGPAVCSRTTRRTGIAARGRCGDVGGDVGGTAGACLGRLLTYPAKSESFGMQSIPARNPLLRPG